MPIDRREFIKNGLLATGVVAAGGAATASILSEAGTIKPPKAGGPTLGMTAEGELVVQERAGLASADPAVRRGVANRRWVMVIDLAACNGCGKCTEDCNAMHRTPGDRAWIRVFKMHDAETASAYWFPRPCFHCDNPPCTRVCPVNATFKRQDGVVLIDNERCIGCRFCMAACPYSARVFNWGRPSAAGKPGDAAHAQDYSPEKGFPRRVGTVEKCDFCPEQLSAGSLPACAASCDMGAIYFGDEIEDAVTNSKHQTVRLTTLLKDRGGYRHLEELGTQPRVWYLPPVHRRYPAPGEHAHGEATERD